MMKATTLLFAMALLTAGPAAAQTPPACATPEYRQFDFWVGRWDVYPTGQDKLVAHSLIETLYGGRAIRENWMPVQGGGGGSLVRMTYTRDDRGWVRQFGEASTDGGKTWTVTFDLTYRPSSGMTPLGG